MRRSPWVLVLTAGALGAPFLVALTDPGGTEAPAPAASGPAVAAVPAPVPVSDARLLPPRPAPPAPGAARTDDGRGAAEPEAAPDPDETVDDAPPADEAADEGAADDEEASAAEAATARGGREISVLDHGAVGDGETDDTAALQRALDSADAGDAVVLPAGRTFAHDDVLRLRRDGTTLTGGGTLLATDAERSTLWVEADGATVSDVVVEGAGGERGGTWDDTGLLLRGTRGVTVEDVVVRDATSAGVFVDGSTAFVLRDVVVEDSRADGIHITGGSSEGLLADPVVRRSGDDGIAVVSYRDVADPVRSITVASPRVETTTWGRGLSVVGGRDVTYTDVFVEGSDAAALYLASEENWSTHATTGVSVEGGTVVGANTSEEVDHGAVLVYSGDAARPVSDVRVTGLTIRDTDERASREVGVLGAPAEDVVMEDITVEGSERGLFVSTNDASVFALRGWTRNGEPVADVLQD